MKLLPRDLGLFWEVRLVQARDNSARLGADPPPPRLGWLERWVGRGTCLSEKEAASVVPAGATTLIALGSGIGVTVWAATLMVGGLLSKSAGIDPDTILPALLLGAPFPALTLGGLGARALFRRVVNRPLGEDEVNRLLEKVQDPMHRQYLELVRDAVRMPVPVEAEENLREALRALAETLSTLPPLEHRALDTPALRCEAAALLEEAGRQPDRVTAESIERRARAILYRVEAHEQSALMAQRNEALRNELEAQMHALREGLVALQLRSAEPHAFATLASAARQVAAEAGGIASARRELEEILVPRPPAGPAEEPVVLHGPMG